MPALPLQVSEYPLFTNIEQPKRERGNDDHTELKVWRNFINLMIAIDNLHRI
jgi:hypothetical protein